MHPKQIVNRFASDCFEAWEWANAAAGMGWRVVTVIHRDANGGFMVWAEAPDGADPDGWDAHLVELRRASRSRQGGE